MMPLLNELTVVMDQLEHFRVSWILLVYPSSEKKSVEGGTCRNRSHWAGVTAALCVCSVAAFPSQFSAK